MAHWAILQLPHQDFLLNSVLFVWFGFFLTFKFCFGVQVVRAEGESEEM